MNKQMNEQTNERTPTLINIDWTEKEPYVPKWKQVKLFDIHKSL